MIFNCYTCEEELSTMSIPEILLLSTWLGSDTQLGHREFLALSFQVKDVPLPGKTWGTDRERGTQYSLVPIICPLCHQCQQLICIAQAQLNKRLQQINTSETPLANNARPSA